MKTWRFNIVPGDEGLCPHRLQGNAFTPEPSAFNTQRPSKRTSVWSTRLGCIWWTEPKCENHFSFEAARERLALMVIVSRRPVVLRQRFTLSPETGEEHPAAATGRVVNVLNPLRSYALDYFSERLASWTVFSATYGCLGRCDKGAFRSFETCQVLIQSKSLGLIQQVIGQEDVIIDRTLILIMVLFNTWQKESWCCSCVCWLPAKALPH